MDHFIYLVSDEVNSGLKLIPELTHEHFQLTHEPEQVHLTPYPVMNVSFAVQVVSSTAANVLRNYYGEEIHGTAKLCEYMDKLFDYSSVRNQIEGAKKRKPFLQSHTNLSDEHIN